MKQPSPPFRRSRLVLLAGGLLLAYGCSSSDGGTAPGSGGATAGGKGGGAGNATNGAGGGATTGAGGGASTGAGGSPFGAGGRAGGSGGGGVGGSAGANGAAGSGAAGAGAGDDFVTGVTVTVHPQTATILVVNWTQARAAETVRLEFSFAGSTVMLSRGGAGTAGAHRDVVLGVPSATAVTVRIVSRQAGIDYKTRDYTGTTGALPAGLPRPTFVSYDAALASPDRWMFGAVEDSLGGCGTSQCYYGGQFWVYIMDRQARVVWYYADASTNASTSFQRIARDGEYIWLEHSRTGTRSVTKMTLDRQYMQTVAVAGLAEAIDVTTDGSLLYDANNELREMNRAGTIRTIFSCRTHFGAAYNCYTNTINWNPADDTVLMSYPEPNTVIQVNRQTGAVVATYGDAAGSYTFATAGWSFEWQHFPNITAAGTLLVSSHLPMFPEGTAPGPMHHGFQEFDIDRTNRRLVQRWIYSEGTEWPISKGMALRLANGNTLVNYGTGGVIKEVTADKRIAFQVKFDVATGNDFTNKMVGHNVLIDDLYALNGGGPR